MGQEAGGMSSTNKMMVIEEFFYSSHYLEFGSIDGVVLIVWAVSNAWSNWWLSSTGMRVVHHTPGGGGGGQLPWFVRGYVLISVL